MLPRAVRSAVPQVTRAPARASVPAVRAFGSTARRAGDGETDPDLVASLHQEIQYEAEASERAEGEPEWLEQFKSEGVWRIEDKKGSDEIALTRDFGKEQIRVLFSIGEIDTTDPTSELEEDDAGQLSNSEDEFHGSFPVRCAVNITKVGALAADRDSLLRRGMAR